MRAAPPDDAGRFDDLRGAAPRFALPVAVLAAVAGVLIATSRFGSGLTPDSVTYVTGARSLADGHGYTDGFGRAIDLFPPGYSAVLSIGERLGMNALDFGRALSAVTLAVTVFLGWLLVRRHVRSPAIQAVTTIVIGCSAVLLEIYAKLLSEHLFVPVVLGFVLVCEQIVEHPRAYAWPAAAVVLAWAAFYLRYAGLSLLAIGAFVVLFAGWADSRGRAFARAVGFAVAGASLPVVWMVRNQDATGNPLGPRSESSVTFLGNARRVVKELTLWVATKLTPHALRPLVFVAVMVALVVVVAWLWRRHAPIPADWRAMVPLTLTIAVYVLYLIVSATLVAFAAIDTRFMVPAYVPLVVLGAWTFENIRDRLPSSSLRTLATAIAVVWVAANLVWFAGRTVTDARHGAGGYATARFQHSRILRDADTLDLSTETFSNDPAAIFILLDKNVRLSVPKTFFNSPTKTRSLPRFLDTVACAGKAQLIWFEPNMRAYLYTPEELQRSLILRPIVERKDGVIYDVRPRPGVTPECSH